MDLQRQVLPSHRIQKIKTDRELRAEARVYFSPEQFLRVPEDQVHGRHLQDRSVEVKAYTVLFRHAVEAPSVIGLVRIQSAHLLHPLPAPHSGVKIGNDPEWLRGLLDKSLLKQISADHDEVIVPVRVYKIRHPIHAFRFYFVSDPPFQKIALLEFLQNIFLRIV